MDFKNAKAENIVVERAKDVNNLGGNGEGNVLMRADMIDFKTWDVQVEKHLNRAWSTKTEARNEPEEWEIDLSKLDIKNVIAHGTYGTVYKGVYDGQDVAGNLRFILDLSKDFAVSFVMCVDS